MRLIFVAIGLWGIADGVFLAVAPERWARWWGGWLDVIAHNRWIHWGTVVLEIGLSASLLVSIPQRSDRS